MAKIKSGTPDSYFSYFYSLNIYNEQFFKLLARLLYSFSISWIDDVDQSVSVSKVITPVLTQGLLSPDVPYIQLKLLVSQVLDVEALCGSNCANVLNKMMATSFESVLRMVVLPALSKPSTKILSYYFFFFFRFRRIPIKPPPCVLLISFKLVLNFINQSTLLNSMKELLWFYYFFFL